MSVLGEVSKYWTEKANFSPSGEITGSSMRAIFLMEEVTISVSLWQLICDIPIFKISNISKHPHVLFLTFIVMGREGQVYMWEKGDHQHCNLRSNLVGSERLVHRNMEIASHSRLHNQGLVRVRLYERCV